MAADPVFDPTSSDLPIVDILTDVQVALSSGPSLIVHAPPGAGKSTLLPLALLNADWLGGKKIIMLEPRRLAAKSIAARMADLLGEKVGESIGYRIRFEQRVSEKTIIEVVTEGIVTRMLQSDNALEDYALVIFDEFHERSIHADVAMALCREVQQVLRPELKMLIMSATLDLPGLTEILKAPVIESKGRQYPVDLHYLGDADERMIPELTCRAVLKAIREEDGDILVFLPGQGEIRKCEEILRAERGDFLLYPLFGQLPMNRQRAAILPHKEGRRKVVLATSIAETSLTIEGIKVVIDCGFGRTQKFDPKSGLTRLETVRISQDGADQRAGRAGRLGPGICYRLWTKARQSQLEAHHTPEIMQADLASLVLDMAEFGVQDVEKLAWLTPPPSGSVAKATNTLEELEALDASGITDHGKAMNRLPCHPRIAHMLLEADNSGTVGTATDIAALLEERDPMYQEKGIDINLRLEILRRNRRDQNLGRFSRIEKVAESYRRLFDIEEDNEPVDAYETGFLLARAYPERIACARPGNNAQFQLANGKLAQAGHKDDLAHEPWLAVAHVDARDGMGKIFLASPLDPKDLAPLLKEKETISWDTNKGGLQATLDLRIGSIVLRSTPLPDPDPSLLKEAIIQAVKKEGARLLNFSDEVQLLQARILSLRKWNPSEKWPDFTAEGLLATSDTWLAPYLDDVEDPEDLEDLNLYEILLHSLEYDQQKKLVELAPEKIEVPTGSKISLVYLPNGQPPVLAVRLQECFGLTETPRINNGKTSVVMHLLSPGFKPVQVTSDLTNFWKDTYFEVRKEMKRRYPKHEWPDNPLDAEPIRGVKRKK